MANQNPLDEFESSKSGSWLEVGFLAVLFVVVVFGLFQLQHQQEISHREVLGQIDPTGVADNAEFTRSKTPALGL